MTVWLPEYTGREANAQDPTPDGSGGFSGGSAGFDAPPDDGNDASAWSQIREGLATADQALDVVGNAADLFDDDPPPALQPVNNFTPAAPQPDAPPAPVTTTYGLAGVLALTKTPTGWVVDILGRQISPLLAVAALGGIYGVYKILFASPRRGRRRRLRR